jgi:hypothetical protein
MVDPTLENLARQAALGDPAAAETLFRQLEGVLRLLKGDLLEQVAQTALALKARGDDQAAPPSSGVPAGLPPKAEIPPEVLEWARWQFSEEELTANLREVREKGGLELKDFLHELEQVVEGR